VTGGATATINNSSSGATYNFSGLIDTNTSNTVTFNGGSNATYVMGGGIYAHGSGSMVFSAGPSTSAPSRPPATATAPATTAFPSRAAAV